MEDRIIAGLRELYRQQQWHLDESARIQRVFDEAREVLEGGAVEPIAAPRQPAVRTAKKRPSIATRPVVVQPDESSTLESVVNTARELARVNGHVLDDSDVRNGEWVAQCRHCESIAIVEVVNHRAVFSGSATDKKCRKQSA